MHEWHCVNPMWFVFRSCRGVYRPVRARCRSSRCNSLKIFFGSPRLFDATWTLPRFTTVQTELRDLLTSFTIIHIDTPSLERISIAVCFSLDSSARRPIFDIESVTWCLWTEDLSFYFLLNSLLVLFFYFSHFLMASLFLFQRKSPITLSLHCFRLLRYVRVEQTTPTIAIRRNKGFHNNPKTVNTHMYVSAFLSVYRNAVAGHHSNWRYVCNCSMWFTVQ